MDSMKAAEKVVERLGELPAMPTIVSEVLHLMEDPRSDTNVICRSLQQDPSLTAKILRISNSAYYGMKQYVGTLKLALVVLGVREVRHIVLGVAVFDMFGSRLDAALPLELWGHSVRVGGLCKNLGGRLKLALQGEDFIAGLLHDIGKMVLWNKSGEKYESIYFPLKHQHKALLAAEYEAYGFDHCDAAAALATRWNLPLALRDALWMHHPRGSALLTEAKDPMLAALVRVANDAAHVHALGHPGDEPAGVDEAWAVLDAAPSPIPRAERGRVMEFFEETADSPIPTL